MVDDEIWSSLDSSTNKDDWAYGAMLAVFGEQAKFYRIRKPRSLDEDLRIFPSNPPVLHVLERKSITVYMFISIETLHFILFC